MAIGGNAVSFRSYCTKHDKGYLLKEWDVERNWPLRPEDIGSTNTTRVWWKCDKGHVWQTQLASRARGNSGCPICMRENIAERVARRRAAETEKKQVSERRSEAEDTEKR